MPIGRSPAGLGLESATGSRQHGCVERPRSVACGAGQQLPSRRRYEVAPRGTYVQIANRVRQLIQRGELPPGAMVPSELSLAELHGVSRGTVRSALALLSDEGLIEVVPGQGRRVVGSSDVHQPSTAWERIARSLQRQLEAGEFSSGSPMPSEAELMDAYGCSRNTVRRAYQHLVEEGLVVVRHGAGAFPAQR
jgi:DNA-binding GntR family transcriptional regulator